MYEFMIECKMEQNSNLWTIMYMVRLSYRYCEQKIPTLLWLSNDTHLKLIFMSFISFLVMLNTTSEASFMVNHCGDYYQTWQRDSKIEGC